MSTTLQPQFTPQSNKYAAKGIWFREEIVKREINIFKTDKVEKLEDIFNRGLKRVNPENLSEEVDGMVYIFILFFCFHLLEQKYFVSIPTYGCMGKSLDR